MPRRHKAPVTVAVTRMLVLITALVAAVVFTGAAPANAWTGNCKTVDFTPWNNFTGKATNGDGRKEEFTRGPVGYNHILHRYQQSNGSWTPWSYHLGGESLGAVKAVRNRDNRVVAFVVGTDHQVYFNYQLSPGSSDSYSGWIPLGGYATANPLVLTNYDGRIEVFVRGSDNALHHRWQYLDYSWSDWTTLGGTLTSYPWGERDSEGKLLVHVRGTDCYTWTTWQTSAGGSWGGWSRGAHLG
jgi:hypothetical protein